MFSNEKHLMKDWAGPIIRTFSNGASPVACLLSFLACSAMAAPVINQTSGTFDHKGNVTITGSGFGAKAKAAPVVWDDASGANILEKWHGAWPSNNPTYNAAYRSPIRGIALPHSNISRYIAGAHGQGLAADSGWNVMFWRSYTRSAFPSYTYATWYERADDNWSFSVEGTGALDNNYKTVAFGGDTSTPYAGPNHWYVALNTPKPSSNTDTASYVLSYLNGLQSPDANGHKHWWGSAGNPMSGVWKKVELEIKWTDQSDGYIKLREDGSLRINYAGTTDTYPGTGRSFGIGGYARRYSQPNNWRYWADVYLDETLARVVLANSADLNQATIIEPQIPYSWSTGSINISVNLGKFSTGQQAYLFVVDPTGTRNSAGFPITVGGQQVVIPPPQNLRF